MVFNDGFKHVSTFLDVFVFRQLFALKPITCPVLQVFCVYADMMMIEEVGCESIGQMMKVHAIDDVLEIAVVAIDGKAIINSYTIDGFPMAQFAEDSVFLMITIVQ